MFSLFFSSPCTALNEDTTDTRHSRCAIVEVQPCSLGCSYSSFADKDSGMSRRQCYHLQDSFLVAFTWSMDAKPFRSILGHELQVSVTQCLPTTGTSAQCSYRLALRHSVAMAILWTMRGETAFYNCLLPEFPIGKIKVYGWEGCSGRLIEFMAM